MRSIAYQQSSVEKLILCMRQVNNKKQTDEEKTWIVMYGSEQSQKFADCSCFVTTPSEIGGNSRISGFLNEPWHNFYASSRIGHTTTKQRPTVFPIDTPSYTNVSTPSSFERYLRSKPLPSPPKRRIPWRVQRLFLAPQYLFISTPAVKQVSSPRTGIFPS